MEAMADFESFKPDMSSTEVKSWLLKHLKRLPEPADYYTTAKDFYHIGAYTRALICLKIYVIS